MNTELHEPSQETEVTEEVESQEEAAVAAWRLEQFERLGFTSGSAVVLAAAPVDLNDARRLIASGCPTPTAYAILV
jgi:hypothetical protein